MKFGRRQSEICGTAVPLHESSFYYACAAALTPNANYVKALGLEKSSYSLVARIDKHLAVQVVLALGKVGPLYLALELAASV